jgi:Protein of unknown function (DUF3828)
MIKAILITVLLFMSLNLDCANAKDSVTDVPGDFLRNLYKLYVPQYNKNIYWFNDEKKLSQYFDSNLTSLFLKEDKCKRRTHEICNLDSDPIIDAQDMDEKYPITYQVKNLDSKTSHRYKVTFTNIEQRTLVYELVQTKRGWRISDIIYQKGYSLKKRLSM